MSILDVLTLSKYCRTDLYVLYSYGSVCVILTVYEETFNGCVSKLLDCTVGGTIRFFNFSSKIKHDVVV